MILTLAETVALRARRRVTRPLATASHLRAENKLCHPRFPTNFPAPGRLRYPRIAALAFSVAAVIALFADFAPRDYFIDADHEGVKIAVELDVLAHVNRVTTMGQLTASIAHEVNQPITGAVLNAEAALRWLGAQPPNLEQVRRALGLIVEDGTRAGNVIGGIRALIKKAPPQQACLDLNEAIREVIALTRREAAKAGVSVRTDLADGLPLIYGDRVQLQQVVLNLIINAIEAMGGVAETSRTLLISTGQAEPGGVLVAVRDLGPGLDRRALSTSSTHSTRPSPVAWAWDWRRSAARSSRRTPDTWEPSRTNRAARFFSLHCPYNQTSPFPRSTPGPMPAV